jgi:hypothetical protein
MENRVTTDLQFGWPGTRKVMLVIIVSPGVAATPLTRLRIHFQQVESIHSETPTMYCGA